MEFIQFHPTCLFHPEAKSFLISEAVRGEGGILRNNRGEDFMKRYDARGSLAPRGHRGACDRRGDQTLRREMRVFWISRISRRNSFGSVSRTFTRRACDSGSTCRSRPIPVVPAAHYQCGGIKTDVNGATSLRGLYAIGEVACTGLHGANRLASNSLLEGLVVAHRAAAACVRGRDRLRRQEIPLPEWKSGNVQDVDELVVIYHNWDEIRRLMWDYVGIVRTDKRLQRAQRAVAQSSARNPRVLLEFQSVG